MSEHLTDAQLTAFISGTAGADELLRVDLHLDSCESCRRRSAELPGARGAADSIVGALLPSSMHVSDEELQDYVANRLDRATRQKVRRHLATCDLCAEQVSDLQGWIRTAPVSRRAMWLAAAAVLLLAASVPMLLWSRSERGLASRSVAGLNELSTVERMRLMSVLSDGPGPLPPTILELRSPTEVLLGQTAAPPKFKLASPVGTVVATATPTLEWEPFQGATGYQVSVFDERAALIVRSPAINEPRWTPAQPLPRERTLVWQVSATRGDEVVTEPSAPAPPARFRIVNEAVGARLSAFEHAQPDAHLVLGLLYRDAGIVDAARAHLVKVQETDPYASIARQTLAQLDSRPW